MMNNPLKSLFHKSKIKNTESFFIYACMARRRYMPNLINIEIITKIGMIKINIIAE